MQVFGKVNKRLVKKIIQKLDTLCETRTFRIGISFDFLQQRVILLRRTGIFVSPFFLLLK